MAIAELRISISGHHGAQDLHQRTWSAELRISDADAVLPSTSKMSGSFLYAPSSKAA